MGIRAKSDAFGVLENLSKGMLMSDKMCAFGSREGEREAFTCSCARVYANQS